MPLVNGTGNSPSPGRPTPGVVKQDKSSGGSVDTTKTRPDLQRVRMSSGERPVGAAKGKQPNTEALCPPPPPAGLPVVPHNSPLSVRWPWEAVLGSLFAHRPSARPLPDRYPL